ncbi:hypothetical protein H4R20_003658, partial [Coemansia guatemalensis]
MGLFGSKKGKNKAPRTDTATANANGAEDGFAYGAVRGSSLFYGQRRGMAAEHQRAQASGAHPSRVPDIVPTEEVSTEDNMVLGAARSDAKGASTAAAALGPATTVDQVATAVVDCFENAVPYFRIYTSVLVACHSEPAMSSSLFSEEASIVYSDACYHDLDLSARDSLEPHVYELVADAYAHLRRLRQDQLIVLSGVSGSGKSETAKLITDQICVLASNSGRHSTRAQYQMAYMGAVVEAFSSAQTLESQGATRAGVWQEVQFNERGHISGAKVVPFGLDRWRVTSRIPGERNFNIFYYLLHGSTSAERQEWQFRHGGDESWFEYLAVEKPPSKKAVPAYLHKLPAPSAAHYGYMMDQLRTALKVCGIGQRQQHALFQVVAAIMHLGNVVFADAPDKTEETAVPKNPEEIELAAEYLGISETGLTAALLYKTAMVGGDLCTVFLNSHGASAQRDLLARTLYHLLYYWLIEQLNENVNDPEATNHIAVLQMYGFSQLPVSTVSGDIVSIASFEQLAVNMANERLNGYVLREVLGDETGIARQMHDDAALGLTHVAWTDRLQTMHLISGDYAGRRGGLVGAIESHATGETASDDISLINSINRTFGQNPGFIPGPPPNKRDRQVPQFGIRHCFDAVMYSVDGFCQHNTDLEVGPDFYALFRDTSRSKMVRQMFSISQIALDYHPEEESTIVGTFLSTRPASRPTVRRPVSETAGREERGDEPIPRRARLPHAAQALEYPSELDALDSADPANTFIGEVSGALEDIFAAADYCKIWNVLHIRPDNPANLNSLVGVPDKRFIRQQVQAMGLVDMSQRRAPSEFTVGLTFDSFIERFAPVVSLNSEGANGEQHASTAAALVERVADGQGWIRGQHYTTGHHMVFMTERVWRSIEVQLRIYEKQRRQGRGRAANGAAGHIGAAGSSSILGALASVDNNGELENPPMRFGFDNSDDAASTVFGSEVGSNDGFDPEEDGLFSGDAASDYDDYDPRSGHGRARSGDSYEEDDEGDYEKAGGWSEINPEHGNFDGDYGAVARSRMMASGREGLVEEVETTPARRCWSRTTNCFTWIIPDWLMNCCG